MNLLDQLAFMIGLPEDNLQAEVFGAFGTGRLNVRKGRLAINLRLACSQKIEIGPIQDMNALLRHRPLSLSCSFT